MKKLVIWAVLASFVGLISCGSDEDEPEAGDGTPKTFSIVYEASAKTGGGELASIVYSDPSLAVENLRETEAKTTTVLVDNPPAEWSFSEKVELNPEESVTLTLTSDCRNIPANGGPCVSFVIKVDGASVATADGYCSAKISN